MKNYSNVALPYLSSIIDRNIQTLERLVERLVVDVQASRSMFAFGSGHSALLPMEIYHRAGGPSFVIPLVSDYLLPTAGPPVVRLLERTEGSSIYLLNRAQPQKAEMIWIVSQSGINPAGIDMALAAKERQLHTVAFTSVIHSQSMPSRHSSKKKLYEICDETVDLSGVAGDAAVQVNPLVFAGPLSTLGGIFLAHTVLTEVILVLENKGVHCAYASVNIGDGGLRNRELEDLASMRDPLLR